MNREDIIRMAREAVSERHEKEFGVWWSWEEIEAFAQLIAAAEREACAKLCEQWDASHPQIIANAIRARGTQ